MRKLLFVVLFVLMTGSALAQAATRVGDYNTNVTLSGNPKNVTTITIGGDPSFVPFVKEWKNFQTTAFPGKTFKDEAELGAALLAQDVAKNGTPKTDTKPAAKLPAIVTLTDEDSRKVVDMTKDAQITDLQAQNLKLQIENAQRQLKELTDAAQKKVGERNAVWQAALRKAGVPDDKFAEYDAADPVAGDPKIVFKLKTKDAPKP